MSKTSFRPRQLDALKPMPIYMAEEVPDLPQYSAINRAVHPMPSGMHKEEESEHHLQRAICTGLIIPTPEVSEIGDTEAYERMYPPTYKLPRQLIHVQPFTMEQDIPDYDMDSEDERWINSQAKKLELTPLKFEEMLDRLEKGSGQMVVTLAEAKTLLKEDEELIIAVYDYWLNKRLKTQRPLIPTVKTELKAGSAANNPYLAFSRRTEKMQTRKNRKNDEASYEKMLKLRRDLTRAVNLLEFVKRREKTKREYLFLTVEIYEKRYQAGDFSGALLQEVSALKNFPSSRPAFAPLFPNHYSVNHWSSKVPLKDDTVPRKEKRQYKKRKHKAGSSSVGGSSVSRSVLDSYHLAQSSEEESSSGLHPGGSPVPAPEEEEDEGPFAFRRNPACNYHAPVANGGFGNWPWTSKEEGGLADKKYRFCLTSVNRPRPRCIGFARRRIGRGGRVILDRESTPLDDLWSSLDFTILDSEKNDSQDPLEREIKNEWLHFRPKAPPKRDRDEDDEESAAEEEPLSPRAGPISLEIESMAIDSSDPCPMSSVVELDLNDLMADQLFPSLADLSGPTDSVDATSSSEDPAQRRRKEPSSPVRTLEETAGVERRQILASVHSPVKRLHVVSVSSDDRLEADASTLSSLLSSPSKADADLIDRLQPAVASPNKQDWLRGSLGLNGPKVDAWSDVSSPSIGCSSFVLCDSSSGTSSTSLVKISPRSSRSNEKCSPLKTMLISKTGSALPSSSDPAGSSATASSSPIVVVSRNHVGVAQKASPSMVVSNHSESLQIPRSVNTSGGLIGSVPGSALRFHRPQPQQHSALSNGPLPAATAAECKLTTSLTQTI